MALSGLLKRIEQGDRLSRSEYLHLRKARRSKPFNNWRTGFAAACIRTTSSPTSLTAILTTATSARLSVHSVPFTASPDLRKGMS